VSAADGAAAAAVGGAGAGAHRVAETSVVVGNQRAKEAVAAAVPANSMHSREYCRLRSVGIQKARRRLIIVVSWHSEWMETAAAGVEGDNYGCPDACYFRRSTKTLPTIRPAEPAAHPLADHPTLLYFGSRYWVVGCRSDR
jgi:hypothetical protein